MRYTVTILFLSLMCCNGLYAPKAAGENIKFFEYTPVEADISPLQPLWEAVCTVESSNVKDTVNRLEMAYGIAQIRDIRIRDYNERTGKGYTLEDCLDSAISREVFMFYAEKIGDYEKAAKKWNGSGYKTEVYWEKVKKELNKTNN